MVLCNIIVNVISSGQPILHNHYPDNRWKSAIASRCLQSVGKTGVSMQLFIRQEVAAWMAYYLLLFDTMRIAIAHWSGRVSPVFDVSDHLLLIDIEDGREQKREGISLLSQNPLERAKELSGLGIEILLCGAISNVMEILLDGVNVQVVGFLCGDIESIVEAFISGNLSDARYWMPGLKGKRPKFRICDGRLYKVQGRGGKKSAVKFPKYGPE